MEINILGTRYSVDIVDKQDDMMSSNNWCGYCDYINKKIVVLKNNEEEHALRHEIIHAFLHESGIKFDLAFHTELCVDWIATQLPKMNEALNEVDNICNIEVQLLTSKEKQFIKDTVRNNVR